jgi:Tfp pilus assembly protein PilX
MQSGVALVAGLVLAATLAALAASSMELASLELLLASNQRFQQEAFYAADSGLAEAEAQGTFTTDPAAAASRYVDLAARQPTPRTGAGTRVAACPAGEVCEYFVRVDTRSGVTIDPRAADPIAAQAGSVRAYHFVIDSIGRSSRGATSHLQAGFYVLAAAGAANLCTPDAASCTGTPASRPVRTFWRQLDID